MTRQPQGIRETAKASRRATAILESLDKLSYGNTEKAALAAIVEARKASNAMSGKLQEMIKAKQWETAVAVSTPAIAQPRVST